MIPSEYPRVSGDFQPSPFFSPVRLYLHTPRACYLIEQTNPDKSSVVSMRLEKAYVLFKLGAAEPRDFQSALLSSRESFEAPKSTENGEQRRFSVRSFLRTSEPIFIPVVFH